MYISNKKVNIVSYTHKNNLTGNLVLVEIKKPKTSLLGKNIEIHIQYHLN